MKCNQCGAQVDGDFCPYCGATSENKTQEPKMEQPEIKANSNTTNTVSKPKKPIYKKWWFWVIIVIVVINIFSRLGGNDNNDTAAEFEWSNMVLSEMLPTPESNYGDLSINSEDYLSIDILKISDEQYRSYVSACREKGFTVDVEEYGTTFTAKNEAGYELMLYYFESDEEMSIDLTAPSETTKEDDEQTSSIGTDKEQDENTESNTDSNETLQTDNQAKIEMSEKIKSFLFGVNSWDSIGEDESEKIGTGYGLEFDLSMGWGGTSWTYYFSDNENNQSLVLYFVNPEQDNFADHLKSFSYNIENVDESLEYYSSWNRDNDDDGKYGFYVGEKKFEDLSSAYEYFTSLTE